MDTIRVETQNQVTTITLNRPDVRNAFNDTVVRELQEAFESLGDETRVVILTGEGKSFCAGADLNWMKKSATYTQEQNATDAGGMVGLFHAINECPKPVIGRVNGAALGGGLGLISCCDIVVAVERAKFGFTEVKLGLIPAVISPFVLGKLAKTHARRYFMTGEIFDAAQAEKIGLVHEVVASEELDSKVNELVQTILSNGPVAVAQAKKLIFEVTTRENADAFNYAINEIARLRVSAEGQEGLGAFLEKRAPSWQKE